MRRSGRIRKPTEKVTARSARIAATDAVTGPRALTLADLRPKVPEPATYAEAIGDSQYGSQWEKAIQAELESLAAFNTWTVQDKSQLPAGRNPVGCRWVFKVKYCGDGRIDRFKARLVAQGFSQRYGIDYTETFAPTLKFDTLRLLLAIAAIENLQIHQMDVVSAYLAGEIDEEEI